jgi:hypothetical protein
MWTVRKWITAISAIAMFLPLLAMAGRRKDTIDRLNAPTSDGSPTLKQTGDWLAKTLADYGGENDSPTCGLAIDNSCTLHWSDGKGRGSESFSVPLGAVTSVEIVPQNWNGGDRWLDLTIRTGNVAAIRQDGTSFAEAQTWFVLGRRMPAAKPSESLPQVPDQMAPRIQTALQHAVSLCQNTYQSPSQPDNLFSAPIAPTATLAANPNAVQAGQSITLTWQTQNADQITIEGLGTVSASGSRTLVPTESTTYKLSAKGIGGTQEAIARVTVNATPVTNYEQQLKNAMALWKNNQVSEASSAVAALIKSDPNRWEGYGLAGAIEKAQNKLPEAKAAYQRALGVAPDSVKPQITQAIQQIEAEMGNP